MSLGSPVPPPPPAPGGARWDRRGHKGLHGFAVDLLKHEQDLGAFGNQLTLTAGVELRRTYNKRRSVWLEANPRG